MGQIGLHADPSMQAAIFRVQLGRAPFTDTAHRRPSEYLPSVLPTAFLDWAVRRVSQGHPPVVSVIVNIALNIYVC